jgi:hypothetical protein
MDFRYSVPDYDENRGVQRGLQGNSRILVKVLGNTVAIQSNPEGLITLAKHLLTLAQPTVPDGFHCHYDAGHQLEVGSAHLVLELDRTT